MTVTTTSRSPDGIEPIVAWRAWSLRERDGRLELAPIVRRAMSWPARHPMRARCTIRTTSHRPPGERCTCGVYATRWPSRLATAGALHARVAVIGSVSLWGRVVEHARGYRAEFAYPDRIRLGCPRCLIHREISTPVAVLQDQAGFLVPVCERHRPTGRIRHDVREIEQRLLQTYAVDPLPDEVLRTAGFRPWHEAIPPVAEVRASLGEQRLARRLVRTIGVATLAFFVLRPFGFLGPSVEGNFGPSPTPPPTVALAPERPSSVERNAARPDVRPADRAPQPRLGLAAVCALENADGTVGVVGCSTPGSLFGFARRPAEPRDTCTDPNQAFTAKRGFSVCWLGFGDSAPARSELRMPKVHWWDLAD